MTSGYLKRNTMAKVQKTTIIAILVALLMSGCASTRLETTPQSQVTQAEQDFQSLVDQLSLMSFRLEELEDLYNDAKLTSSLLPFSQVFSDGQEAYLRKDFPAVIALIDAIIRDPVNFQEPLFPAALYYLADSHFQLGNFDLGRFYFERLAGLNTNDYTANALEKLARIAKKQRNWQPLIPFVPSLKTIDSISPGGRYAIGYALFQLGELDSAIQILDATIEGSDWYAQARYTIAIAHVREERLPSALDELDHILNLSPDTEVISEVQQWAHLSKARILFELDDLTAATESYQAINRESVHFAESVYELAQTQVRYAQGLMNPGDKRKAYTRALATLELLFILDEEEKTIAEALVLKAAILIRIGQTDEGKLTLAYLLERYDPLTSYMEDLPNQISTLTTYYDLLSPGFRSEELNLVPMVSQYLEGGQKLSRGRVLIQDLRDLNRTIDYLVLNSGNLSQKLKIDPKGYFLPSGQRAYEQVDELEASFSEISNQLVVTSSAILRPFLSTEERRVLDDKLAAFESDRLDFSILRGSERAFVKSLAREQDTTSFELTKRPQVQISRDVAETRARYERSLRELQRFLRNFYKRLAQAPGSGSREESQISNRLQEIRSDRMTLNRAMKLNEELQRQILQKSVETRWAAAEELEYLSGVLKQFKAHPTLLKTETRQWLGEKLSQRDTYLKSLSEADTEARREYNVHEGLNLLLLTLRVLESGLSQSFLRTYSLERTIQNTLGGERKLNGVSLALALERAGKVLAKLRARSKRLEVKIRRHIDARLAEMRRDLRRALERLDNQSAALNLAEAKTRELVDVLAMDALADLKTYLQELMIRTEVSQLDILWEEKVKRVRVIDQLLGEQREAVQKVESSFKHLLPRP